jgi:DNA-binding NarL/FixJ family response regulator
VASVNDARLDHTRPEVVITDPLPVYRDGLAAALRSAGWNVVETEGWIDWLGRHEGDAAALVTVEDGADLERIAAAHRANQAATICALLSITTSDTVRSSLAAGASTVVSRDSDSPEVVDVLEAAHDRGRTVLPTGIAQELAAKAVHPPSNGTRIDRHEVEWLRALSEGATVAMLGRDTGYSERQMSRLLHDLYNRLGVRNREEALVRAALWGFLGDASE